MNCQKCKIEIEDRDLRRESLSDAAQAHVAACADCRVFGEERLALRYLVGGLEKISAPADFDFRMRARMAAERDKRAPRAAWLSFSPAKLSWPLAACLALVVSASLYFQKAQPDAPANASAEQPRATATRAPGVSVIEAVPAPASSTTSSAASSSAPSRVRNAGHMQTASSDIRLSLTAASSKISAAQSPRHIPSSPGARAGIERESVQVEESISTSLKGSTPRVAASAAPRVEGAWSPLQLDAPEGRLNVLLRDTTGGARTISVDSVSFGSRDMMERPGAAFTKASL
ncbi:MAG TPA: hypothetical protein VGB61_14075, partial [Pyrinomonadaceae bacterium]